MFEEYTRNLDANSFLTKRINYITRFEELLKGIYTNYKQIITDKVKVPKDENKIRNILVDDYLSKNLDEYKFKKEEKNNLGRVDIFIQETLSDDQPEFIIECKIIDSKSPNGTTGKNAEYIKNGIQRFLTEYYLSYNNFYVNAMIGFVVEEIDIVKNMSSINTLTTKILNNFFHILERMLFEEDNLFKTRYRTCNNKEFIIYHQMMDFSKSV